MGPPAPLARTHLASSARWASPSTSLPVSRRTSNGSTCCARGRTRTGTACGRGILSPLRLPVSPPGRCSVEYLRRRNPISILVFDHQCGQEWVDVLRASLPWSQGPTYRQLAGHYPNVSERSGNRAKGKTTSGPATEQRGARHALSRRDRRSTRRLAGQATASPSGRQLFPPGRGQTATESRARRGGDQLRRCAPSR